MLKTIEPVIVPATVLFSLIVACAGGALPRQDCSWTIDHCLT
jgi:hypothetical protein